MGGGWRIAREGRGATAVAAPAVTAAAALAAADAAALAVLTPARGSRQRVVRGTTTEEMANGGNGAGGP